jgi:predicted XRE-type DNA-binding protein
VNDFYIYIYLDPRKLGRYCYENICFLYSPLYVGKGKDRRWKNINGRNPHFENKINKIKKLGLEPIVIKLFENLSEKESLDKEIELIKEIGRFDLKTGPIVNETIGGEGKSGNIVLEETRKKMSEKKKGISRSIETRNKIKENHANFKGENNSTSKLIEQDVIEIKMLLIEKNFTQTQIAIIFGVNRAAISKIKTGRTWNHIKI